MSTAAVVSSAESAPIVPENGSSESPRSFPASFRDDMLYEIVDGEILEKEMGNLESDIATLLLEFLSRFVRARRLGRMHSETLFRIDQAKDLRRRPDVAFVSHARWPFNRRLPRGAVWDMVPDLAIEVISPTNTATHVQRKIHEYFAAGVSQVWVVFPDQQEAYVYSSLTQIQVVQIGQDLDGGDLIPGFRLALAALFEDEPE
jgi:Uma2 family endonuclease